MLQLPKQTIIFVYKCIYTLKIEIRHWEVASCVKLSALIGLKRHIRLKDRNWSIGLVRRFWEVIDLGSVFWLKYRRDRANFTNAGNIMQSSKERLKRSHRGKEMVCFCILSFGLVLDSNLLGISTEKCLNYNNHLL